jgi:hypothetical protein
MLVCSCSKLARTVLIAKLRVHKRCQAQQGRLTPARYSCLRRARHCRNSARSAASRAMRACVSYASRVSCVATPCNHRHSTAQHSSGKSGASGKLQARGAKAMRSQYLNTVYCIRHHESIQGMPLHQSRRSHHSLAHMTAAAGTSAHMEHMAQP